MKKKISAFVIMLLVSGFVFSGTFGDREKRAVRSFLSGGDYIEYVGDDDESIFIKASNVLNVTARGEKLTVHYTNGGQDTFTWETIENDSMNNLVVYKTKKEFDWEAWGDELANLINGRDIKIATNGGKVLNICVWNEEFMTRVKKYYPGYNERNDTIGDVKVNWIITPNQGNEYQDHLDDALARQAFVNDDDKIDIFLVEPDYALKYTDTPYTLDIKADLGFTDADLSKQFQYTKDLATAGGKLKGLSWQCCPGGVIYRRSIAKALFGTDDPETVQTKISNWSDFDKVAADAKAKGYFMVSGYDDDYRVFSDNVKTPWVVNGKINIDDSIREWVAQQKEYTDKGYNNKAALWSQEQWDGAKKDGKVFCYFGPAWFIDFSLAPQVGDAETGSYGDWAFCKGPQGYSWGGTWICAAAGTDNKTLVKDILAKLTTDDEVMTRIAKEEGDFTNNEKAMEAVANSDYGNPFLGGQNHIKFFLASAKSIDKSTISPYDQGMNEEIQAAMHDYFNGKVDEATAWENFYTAIKEKYPNLTR